MEPVVFFGVTGYYVDFVNFREFVGIFFENWAQMLEDMMAIISFHIVAVDGDKSWFPKNVYIYSVDLVPRCADLETRQMGKW